MESKICTKCGEEKPLIEFYFDRVKNCYKGGCKPCITAQVKARAKRNRTSKQHFKALAKKYGVKKTPLFGPQDELTRLAVCRPWR